LQNKNSPHQEEEEEEVTRVHTYLQHAAGATLE
jgi:hypothetical protein